MPVHRLPRLFSFITSCLLSALCFSAAGAEEPSAAMSAGAVDPVIPKPAPLDAFHHYAHTLHELTERRRSTVHFENQQSILRGAQVGFVNVGDGNLSLARRDLVVIGLLPIVVARVYDSSASDSGDFGPGWRLSIAETITLQADGAALLLDESGSATRFIERGGRFVQEIPHPTDVISLTRRNGHIFEMKLASGIEKRYRLIEDQFRLSQVTDRNGNTIHLHYAQGKLARIDGMNGRFAVLERGAVGHVVKVTDEQGRSVAYRYNSQDQLVEVLDLGGNAWAYTYGLNGRLSAGLDPLGYVDFEAHYDEQGWAIEVINRGQTTEYEYAAGTTRVVDERGRVSTFTQNEVGITVSVRNHVSVTTRLALDELNRVSKLYRNEITKAEFFYEDNGRLSSLRQLTGDGLQTISYQYDRTGRLISADDDTGRLRLTLRYDPNGNVRLVQRGEEKTIYRHAANGALVSLSRSDGKRYAFGTDADGQITRVTDREVRVIELRYLSTGQLEQIRFADGTTHTYGYEAVGLRVFIQPSDAKLLRTYYSASGNLTLLEHVSSTGATQSDYYEYDETNRLNRIEFDRPSVGGTTISARELSYDQAGEVVNEKTPSNDLRFSYDAQDRLAAVADGSKALSYEYGEDEPDMREQLDHETRINLLPWSSSGTTIGTSNEIVNNRTRLAPYQTVHLDRNLEVFRVISDIGITLPHQAIEDSLARMRLLDLSQATFAQKAHFSKPSNVLFIPAEYRFINCFYQPPCDPNGVGISNVSRWRLMGSTDFDEADLQACNGDTGILRNRVRFQAQIQATLVAVTQRSTNNVISAATCQGLIDQLALAIPDKDVAKFQSALGKARNWVTACAQKGGCTTVDRKSWFSAGSSTHHVDTEVFGGVACE